MPLPDATAGGGSPEKKRTGLSKPKARPADVVGIEVGASAAEGAPAVRLRRGADGVPRIAAAGFLPVVGDLPSILALPEDTPGVWSLPPAFRASAAALAVSAPEALVRQSDSVEDATADFEPGTLRTKAVAGGGAHGDLPFVAFLPEALARRVARLLPEGHKPTAVSLQVSPLARVNAFAASTAFEATDGTALLIQIADRSITIAIFTKGKISLYREHSIGEEDALRAIAGPMNVDEATARELLEGNLVDPAPFLGPLLSPIFRQVELSADYALRRDGCLIDRFFVAGAPATAPHVAALFKEQTGRACEVCDPLAGFPAEPTAALPADFAAASGRFAAALGAAVAVMEEVPS